MSTVSKILAWKLGSAYRDPRGKAVLTSSRRRDVEDRAGAQVTFDVVSGHRDAGNTSCPGATTYARLPALRSAVAADLGPNLVDPVLSGPTAVPVGATSGQAALSWNLTDAAGRPVSRR